jgi:type I restriction enzyme S subunit
MKYVFLFQIEGTTKRRLYQFIPYHYGPFAQELYTDLETLQEQGLITVDNSEEDKTRISLLNSEAVETELEELPDDLQADIEAIIDSYGDLDLTALLATVYEKYPAYAKKSKLKQRKPKPKKEET